jgi:hypothetical protein
LGVGGAVGASITLADFSASCQLPPRSIERCKRYPIVPTIFNCGGKSQAVAAEHGFERHAESQQLGRPRPYLGNYRSARRPSICVRCAYPAAAASLRRRHCFDCHFITMTDIC